MATESLIDGWWSTFGLGSETVDIAKTKERRSLSPRNALRRASSEVTEPPKTRKNRSPPPRPPVRVRTPPLAEAAAPSVAAVPPPRGRPALKFDSTPSQASALDRQRCGEIDTEGASTSNGNKFTSIAPHLLPPPPPTGSLRNDRTHTPPSSGTGRLARQRPAPLGVKKQHKGREPGSARSESPPHSPPMKGLNPSIGQDEVDDGVELRPRAVTGTERLRRMVGFRKSKTPSRGALLSGVGSAMAEGISNPVGRMLMNNVLVNRAAVFLAHGNTKVEETAISLEENSACVEKDSGHAHQSVHSSAANHNAQQRAAERAAKAATAMAQWEWLGRPEVLPAQLKQNGLLDDRHQRRSVKCVVWDAPHCSAKEKFALKVMVRGSIQGGRRDAKACEALNERDIMLALKGSPWHTQLINSFYSENHLYMLLEYAPSLSMDQHIEWGRGLKRGGVMALRFYTACAIEALAYMYEKQIVHRDVKPSNLLIDGQGYLKLCDYGLSKFLKVGERTSTHLGTLAYIPPEQVNKDSYDHSTDLWSLGVTVYEMAYGTTPFEPLDSETASDQEWRADLERNIRVVQLNFPQDPQQRTSLPCRLFIKNLLQRDPRDRLGWQEKGLNYACIRKHPFFAKIDWASLSARKTPPPIIDNAPALPTALSL